MRGSEDSVYIIAVMFTFIIGLLSLFLFYTSQSTGSAAEMEKIKLVRNYLGISDEIIDKISNSKSLRASFGLEGFLEGSNAIVVRNNGDVPLSGFRLIVDGEELYPAISPDVLFPGSYGIVVLDNDTFERISDSSLSELITRQGAKILIRK